MNNKQFCTEQCVVGCIVTQIFDTLKTNRETHDWKLNSTEITTIADFHLQRQ